MSRPRRCQSRLLPGGLFLTLLFLALNVAAAQALCVNTCGPPSESAPTVNVSSYQSAAFSGSVNPNGDDTKYQFFYLGAYHDEYLGQSGHSPQAGLPASYVPSQVSWSANGLIPNTSYQVQLEAQNNYGQTASEWTSFRTPLAPPLTIALRAAHRFMRTMGDAGLSAHLGGAQAGAAAEWQISFWPFTTYRALTSTILPGSGQISYPSVALGSVWSLRRNARVRLELTGYGGTYPEPYQTREPSFTPWRSLYVLPSLQFYAEPETADSGLAPSKRRPGVFEIGLRVVAPLSFRYRGPIAYVYTRAGQRAPWRLLFSRRVKPLRDPFFTNNVIAGAGLLLFAPHLHARGRFLICTRTPLVAHMGPAFRFGACGRRILTGEGPFGASEEVPNSSTRA